MCEKCILLYTDMHLYLQKCEVLFRLVPYKSHMENSFNDLAHLISIWIMFIFKDISPNLSDRKCLMSDVGRTES